MCLYSCTKKVDEPNLTAIYQYPENAHISDNNGVPNKKVFPYYYPDSIHYILQDRDSLGAKIPNWNGSEDFDWIRDWSSSYLYRAEEPILYNYYLGTDRFRFFWMRAFHEPVIITLRTDGFKVLLETKILKTYPLHYLHDREGVAQIDSIKKTNLKSDIVLNKTKKVSLDNWTNFVNLLDKHNFWEMVPVEREIGLDGSEWILEAHCKDRYWFVNRWAPSKYDAIRGLGECLIRLSGMEEEIY